MRILSKMHMTVRHLAVFTLVYSQQEFFSFTELAQIMEMPKGALTRVLDYLCIEGLVKRQRMDHDMRKMRVLRTPEGEEFSRKLEM